jgi:uncharacterized protein involved in exopolysaccharide biosynthesis
MELNDAVRRVLGHWPLILGFVAAAIAAAVLINSNGPTYTASARLALDANDPETRPEATGIADTARAIATSPTQVDQALRAARITGRDPEKVAREDIDVQSLGASGVVELKVSDSDKRVVAPLANALARRVIVTRLDVTRGEVKRVSADLVRRIAALNRRIVAADTAAAARPRSTAAQRRDILVQARSALEAQRVSLLASGAQLRDPGIISSATPPSKADDSNLLPDVILAAFLGLVLGIGVASLIETLRPTLAGGEAIARAVDAPLLGKLRVGSDGGPILSDVLSLGMYLRLAAKAAAVRHVKLISASGNVDLTYVAQLLDAATPERGGDGLPPGRSPAPAPVVVGTSGPAAGADPAGAATVQSADDPTTAVGIRPFSLNSAVANGVASGLVLVTPKRLKQSELAGARHLLRVTPAPLLGVIVYDGRPSDRRSEGEEEA